MFRLTIENFQSIKGPLTIQVDGLTCIIGESNIGKSAIIRALQALLTNRCGDDFITTDQTFCKVTLEAGGHVVIWTKTRSTASYEVDGQLFTKLNGDVPAEVRRLGFDSLLVGKEDFWPQIHEQGDHPFALKEGPTVTASLLGVNEEARQVVRAVKSVQKIVTESRREETFLSNKLHAQNTLTAKVEELGEKIETSYKSASEWQARQAANEGRVETLSRLKQTFDRLTPRTQVQLPTSPESPSADRLIALQLLIEKYKTLLRRSEAVVPEQVSPPLFSDRPLRLSELIQKYKKFPTELPNLDAVQSVPEYDFLAERLAVMRSQHQTAVAVMQPKVVELERISASLKETEQDLERIKVEFKVCPFCNTLLTKDHDECLVKS